MITYYSSYLELALTLFDWGFICVSCILFIVHRLFYPSICLPTVSFLLSLFCGNTGKCTTLFKKRMQQFVRLESPVSFIKVMNEFDIKNSHRYDV